ncbi:hypothetical protein NX722_00390 [Endozoicomonas gorgoniicola]|uniref:Uncharacterized protein n=1 Tax=Endozoicomonas gorgoniicola TaxID=1234144 RepID=A0ABT3MP32_9GAMM|nr:hypothetical protein [Endozoicomonas gorgoniicola]MCW7551140.1 hypothetical protein [Endozoicomonas gorgoniicola]
MLRKWSQRRNLVSEANTLLLTKPLFFQNTTLLTGARQTAPGRRGENRFYGYAFKPDDLDISDAFSKGFFPRYLDGPSREMRDMMVPRPRNLSGEVVIQSYICHYAACQSYLFCNIYLVDLREVGGIVRGPSNPRFATHPSVMPADRDGYRSGDGAFEYFPFTRQLYRLETLAPVPGEAVIGMVTCSTTRSPVSRLKLHVNPGYKEGLEGTRDIVDLFNGESSWVMV